MTNQSKLLNLDTIFNSFISKSQCSFKKHSLKVTFMWSSDENCSYKRPSNLFCKSFVVLSFNIIIVERAESSSYMTVHLQEHCLFFSDTMDKWDQSKLEEVIEKKHGEKEKSMPQTEIVSFLKV